MHPLNLGPKITYVIFKPKFRGRTPANKINVHKSLAGSSYNFSFYILILYIAFLYFKWPRNYNPVDETLLYRFLYFDVILSSQRVTLSHIGLSRLPSNTGRGINRHRIATAFCTLSKIYTCYALYQNTQKSIIRSIIRYACNNKFTIVANSKLIVIFKQKFKG